MEDINSKEELEDVEDVFDRSSKKCPTCGAEIESDAQYCPYCGAKIGESVKAQEEAKEEAPKAVIRPRPLQKGEKIEKSATPTQEFKYGDGYSLSALPLWALYGSWLYPVVALIMSIIGLNKTKNPKDKKMFKVSLITSIVFLVLHVLVIAIAILQGLVVE